MRWIRAFLVVLTLAPSLAFAQSDEVRIDTYDTRSNRTGYVIVNPNTGRYDSYDTRSNRTGYGTITSPSSSGTDSSSSVRRSSNDSNRNGYQSYGSGRRSR